MKQNFPVMMFLALFSIFFIQGHALGSRVLDDFSGTYLDGQKWNDRELVREIVGGKLVSQVGNGPLCCTKHFTHFQNPSTINVIQSDITVLEAVLDSGTNPSLSARIEGLFYNTQASGGAAGDIWAGISIGDRGNGLEAWWNMEECLNDERTNWSNKGSGTLISPGSLTYGTAYTAELAYDGNNGFTFTIAGASETTTGPARQRASVVEHKALSTRVSASPSSYDGYLSALFDNVYINNEETIYDNFSSGSLDPTKWRQWSLGLARETSGGKLHMNVQADGSTQTVSIRPNEQATTYLEAKVLIDSASQISSGALGHARIGGYYYNESRGPGSGLSYNGYEGNVWVSSRIELDDSNNLTGYCSLWRHDDADSWGEGTGLFNRDFTTPFAFDTEYTLSIELIDKTFIFKCNNETYLYTVTTPMYEPSQGQYRGLNSRVMADPGESGYMKTTFDEVCLEAIALGVDGDVAPLGTPDGTVNVGDALVALRFALGLETPTQEDSKHGDVAPLGIEGYPDPDGQISVGDALVILRKALGLVNWFYMTDYFPLDGSWERDDWTMFTAQREQEINGLMTRALVNTAERDIGFWTNDEKGLVGHANMDDFSIYAFPTPIVFADAVTKVGEKKENIISDEGDTIKIISELVAVENVSVPAGNFTDCLKFELAVHEITGGQAVFLYKENLWLAKDVGFVKAHNYASPGQGYIFTREGTTRQLLSYHVTNPYDLTADQQAIKDMLKESEKCFADEDIDAWAASVSDSYYDECRDKARRRAEIEAIFANNSEIMLFRSPGEIVVTGDKASAMEEYLTSAINDATGQRWLRWGRELRHFTKENGEWKAYGDQLQFKPAWSGVSVRTETGGVSLKIDLETANCEGELKNLDDQIASLTIAGPPGTSINSDFKQDFHPEWGTGLYWRTEDISNATNGFYTFSLTDVNGNMWVNTDYLHLGLEQPLDIPTLVSPIDDATVIPGDVTLEWNAIDNANYYRVEMENMPNLNTAETQAIVNLPEGSYSWRVRARLYDMYGDFDYESRSGWEDFSVVSSE